MNLVKGLSIFGNGVIKKYIIHDLIRSVKKELNFKIHNLEISFVGLDEIQKINQKHLNYNTPTDVITFNYSASKSVLEGEIIISTDVALKNSKRFKSTHAEEILRLIIHGILHLLGYEDNTVQSLKIMKANEDLLTHKFKSLVS